MTGKICSACKCSKPRDAFCAHRGRKDGLNGRCKACVTAYIQGNLNHVRAIKNESARRRRLENLEHHRKIGRERMAAKRAEDPSAANAKALLNVQKRKAEGWTPAPKTAEQRRLEAAREREELKPRYIRRLLAQKSSLTPANIPQALVEAKQVQLSIQRLLKESK